MNTSAPWMIAGITLSVALLAAAPFYWRRRGAASGLRWVAAGLVPAGLALSGLATMLGRIGVAIGRFVSSFVFSPVVWIGFGLVGAAVLLELGSRAIRVRGVGAAPPALASGAGPSAAAATMSKPGKSKPGRSNPASPTAQPQVGRSAPSNEDNFDDIEALLRKRGIS